MLCRNGVANDGFCRLKERKHTPFVDYGELEYEFVRILTTTLSLGDSDITLRSKQT